MVAVVATGHGYRARCLTCGRAGPEHETKNLAWSALLRAPEERRDLGSSVPYETTGRGSRDRRG